MSRRRIAGYAPAHFVLPTSSRSLAGWPRLGANTASVVWFNGQVLTFDLDNPAQKAQYDAIQKLKQQVSQQQPVTLIDYTKTPLTPPFVPYGTLSPVSPQLLVAPAPSWLQQESIVGVKNSWLVAGGVGLLALLAMGRRRR